VIQKNTRFVLVRPRNPLNIGAAARAMANFGFEEMVAVKPHAPVWKETTSAVGAERLVLAARATQSIEEATGDCALVVGTTALRDRRADRPVVPLPSLADHLRRHHPEVLAGRARAAVLFGSEKTGLPGTYLARCHFWITIPTDDRTPSMNLSHAVALTAYAWAQAEARPAPALRAGAPATGDGGRPPAPGGPRPGGLRGGGVSAVPVRGGEKCARRARSLLAWRIQRPDVALMHGLFRFVLRRVK
jgi:TrmH family RNA methyltransferase